jgi:hypothetical protein
VAEPSPPLTADQRRALGLELDRLLAGQLQRVRRRFLVHGLAVVLLLPAAWIVVAFALDHVLRLPAPIRLLHSAAMLGLCAFAAMRWLRHPLSVHLQPSDVAVLLERVFPELHQRLVSAVQLKGALDGVGGAGGELRNQSTAMIERLLDDTAAAARGLPLERLLDPRRTRQVWAGAASVLLLIAGFAAMAPATARIFVLRHLGADVPYPRATTLVVELPPNGTEVQRVDADGRTELTLAAGGDLHVSVRATGEVPTEVFLDVEAGADRRSVPMQTRPDGRFRHVFRRLAADFQFHARGGDDDRGDRLVVVHTVHPPQVAQIKAELRPPAYTRKPPVVQNGGAIEALTGTAVALSVSVTDQVTSAVAVFLESGKRLQLDPTAVSDDSGTVTAFVGRFTVETGDRYQVELTARNGLRNPNPGTYPVNALQDYAPVGHWLLPDDESGTLLLPDALLCVRGEAHDDFGLLQAQLRIDAGNGRQRELQLLHADAASPPVALSFVELVELKQLLGDQRTAEGVSLQIDLRDNREPVANTTELPRRQVQIVDQGQLAAAIGRHFRSLREAVEQSIDLQGDRRARLAELLAEKPSPGAHTSQALTTVEVGQGRIQTVADQLLHGMMRAFDVHLWNRLETSPVAPTVVDLYLAWHRAHQEPIAYQPAFYRDLLQRQRQGSLGAMETCLDPILSMIATCDHLQSELAPQAVRLLARAQVARGDADLQQTIAAAVEVQANIVASLQKLLGRLDEWNDFQDLVQEARALREKQRDVQNRTEDLRGRK